MDGNATVNTALPAPAEAGGLALDTMTTQAELVHEEFETEADVVTDAGVEPPDDAMGASVDYEHFADGAGHAMAQQSYGVGTAAATFAAATADAEPLVAPADSTYAPGAVGGIGSRLEPDDVPQPQLARVDSTAQAGEPLAQEPSVHQEPVSC